jgi:hypothetical protein
MKEFGSRLLRCGGCRELPLVSFLSFIVVVPALADVNSWIKPGSGYLEEQSSWALGVLPNATQSVMFTNAGWKALAIGTNAAQKFPQSMHIQGLQISSPSNSFNTLLLNFTGFELPLQVTSLSIGINSAVVVQGSKLDVTNTDTTGSLVLGGTFNHGDYSFVKVHDQMTIGTSPGYGAYYLTNGTLSVNSTLSMGDSGPANLFNTAVRTMWALFRSATWAANTISTTGSSPSPIASPSASATSPITPTSTNTAGM